MSMRPARSLALAIGLLAACGISAGAALPQAQTAGASSAGPTAQATPAAGQPAPPVVLDPRKPDPFFQLGVRGDADPGFGVKVAGAPDPGFDVRVKYSALTAAGLHDDTPVSVTVLHPPPATH